MRDGVRDPAPQALALEPVRCDRDEAAHWPAGEIHRAGMRCSERLFCLGPEPEGLLYAVNKEYAKRDHELRDGDEVAVIPPVSGGDFRLSEEPLSLDAVVAEVAWEDAGAIATFVGTTRAHSRGRNVKHLEYEAYAGMAENVMAEIAAELRTRYELCEIAIHHRTGRVDIREPSVMIAVPTWLATGVTVTVTPEVPLALTVAALRTGGSGRSEDARSRLALLRLPQSARILGMSCLANSVVRWLT